VRDVTIARNYAAVLFELGERHGAHDGIVAGLHALRTVLASDPAIRVFLETPKIDVQRKRQALRTALDGRVIPLFLNFVLVVIGKRRQRLFAQIGEQYTTLLDQKLGLAHADVTLAHDPDEATEQRIAGELSRIFGRRVTPVVRVHPDIMGGIIVRYGDRLLDGSLRRRLLSLRRRLAHATLSDS
jgi:F-type H+-transporting ATPase subunit delta